MPNQEHGGAVQALTAFAERFLGMPSTLLARIRWLFAVFALAVVALTAASLLTAPTPVVPHRLVAAGALLCFGVWIALRYRYPGLPVAVDLLAAVATIGGAWGLDRHEAVFAPVFVALYLRALSGSRRAVLATTIVTYLAYEGAVWVVAGTLQPVGVVATLLGFLLSAGVMQLVGAVLGTHEDGARRDAILNRAAVDLLAARDHDRIREIIATTALALASDLDGARVTLWRRTGDRFRLTEAADRAAPPATALPGSVPLAALPPDVLSRTRAGAAFTMIGADACRLQEAVGAPPDAQTVVFAPVLGEGELVAVLALASPGSIPAGLEAALGRLALDAGLALDRADSEERFRGVVLGSSDVIAIFGDDERLTYVSPAVEKVLGTHAETLIGRHVSDLLARDEPADDDADLTLDELVAGGIRRARFVGADGGSLDVELTANRLDGGRLHGVVVNLRDVTDRVLAERRVRESEERFRGLAENSHEGLYLYRFGPPSGFEYVNPALERITGYTLERFREDPALAVAALAPEFRETLGPRRRRGAIGTDRPAEVRFQRPDGSWVWLALQEVELTDDDGHVVAVQGLVTDISQRKSEEQALQRALEQEREASEELRRIDELKGAFLAAVSHELRTPLTTVLGSAETLQRHWERLPEATQRELVVAVVRNGRRLHELLVDLLDVDRLTRGILEPQLERTDLGRLLRRTADHLESDQERVTITAGEVHLDVDAPKIERVVENLLRNAIKHTPDGTPVRASVERSGDGALIVVEDDGPGVAPHLRDVLFEPFRQGPERLTAASPGTGIGLTLVAKLTELHGGRVWIEDAASGGARFCVWLPEAEVAASAGRG